MLEMFTGLFLILSIGCGLVFLANDSYGEMYDWFYDTFKTTIYAILGCIGTILGLALIISLLIVIFLCGIKLLLIGLLHGFIGA